MPDLLDRFGFCAANRRHDVSRFKIAGFPLSIRAEVARAATAHLITNQNVVLFVRIDLPQDRQSPSQTIATRHQAFFAIDCEHSIGRAMTSQVFGAAPATPNTIALSETNSH